jgi:hypothetical protein
MACRAIGGKGSIAILLGVGARNRARTVFREFELPSAKLTVPRCDRMAANRVRVQIRAFAPLDSWAARRRR